MRLIGPACLLAIGTIVGACSSDSSSSGSNGAGFAQACTIDSDCKAGLICPCDPKKICPDVGPDIGLCTIACTEDSQCEAKFGAAFCHVDFGLCVASCSNGKECPAGTVCNSGTGTLTPWCFR